MSDLQVFDNDQFGKLRAFADETDEPLFAATDVAKALGYADATHMTRRLDADEKGLRSVETPGGSQQLSVITEAGLYNAVLGSKIPAAKGFKRWVTHDVIPCIRRRGGYMVARADETPEETMARAVLIANDTISRQRAQIEQLRPKALFADAVAASDGTCLVGELAKMLRQNGVQVGQNRLFKRLRDDGFLGKSGQNYNVPTQYAIERGLFRVKETSITHSDGHVTITRTPKVTGKGQVYFIRRYSDQTEEKGI